MATIENPDVTTPGLSPRAETAFRVVTVLSVALLAIAAAVLSYSGLRDAALRADIDPNLAWIFPLVIDGLTFVGSVGVVYAVLTRTSPWYPWFLTLLGVGVSTTGNVAVSPDDWVSRMVHAAPPVVLALALEALLRVYRARAHRPHPATDTETASPSQDPEPLTPTPEPPRDTSLPKPAPDPTPEPLPSPVDPFQTTAPTRVPQPVGTHPVGVAEQQPPQTTVSAVPDILAESSATTNRDRVKVMLLTEPDITGAEVARRLDIDASYARRILREAREIEGSDEHDDPYSSQESLFTASATGS